MTRHKLDPAINANTGEREPFLAPIFTGRKRAEYVVGIVLWALALAYFWQWWLMSATPNHLAGYILVTALLAWITILPLYFITIFFHAARPTGLSFSTWVSSCPAEGSSPDAVSSPPSGPGAAVWALWGPSVPAGGCCGASAAPAGEAGGGGGTAS